MNEQKQSQMKIVALEEYFLASIDENLKVRNFFIWFKFYQSNDYQNDSCSPKSSIFDFNQLPPPTSIVQKKVAKKEPEIIQTKEFEYNEWTSNALQKVKIILIS